MSSFLAFTLSATLFGFGAAAVILGAALIVQRKVRVRQNRLFWFLSGEIDRRDDPVSYWFCAGPIVVCIAFVPTVLLLQLAQRLYENLIQ